MIIAQQEGRPFQYLQEKIKKEDLAKQIAERDHIEEGLICIFSVLEPFRTFSFRTEKGKPFVASARRKCRFLYFYFINRDFGLMPVKLQTRFPMPIQVYVNGHEWLARKLKQHAIRYTKRENAFLWIEDLARAQKFSDRFCSLDWPSLLSRYAKKINPLTADLLKAMPYYWVTAQSEYSTDILFKKRGSLKRALSTITQSQHTVLWRQGSYELSWKKDPVLLRRRNRQQRLRSVLQAHSRSPD